MPAALTGFTGDHGDAGGRAVSGDASFEFVHAGFSDLSDETADTCDKADLADAPFESVHAGFSGLSDETGDTGDAAFEIKEAAKTAPTVSKAERLMLISPPRLNRSSRTKITAGTSCAAWLKLYWSKCHR